MLSEPLQAAFSTLVASFAADPAMEPAVRVRWSLGDGLGTCDPRADEVPLAVRAAADELAGALPALTRSVTDTVALASLFAEPAGEVLFSWCSASTWRRDIRVAPLLSMADQGGGFEGRVQAVARDRVVQGPLLDSLACAPLLGDGDALAAPDNAQARARLEICVWEAGASALEVPQLGRWLWGSASTFQAMIRGPAHGALRGRVLAARCLEVSARGMPDDADPELVGRTLQVLQPLLLHPEPLVWVHTARALGRLTGALEQLEGTLLDWVLGESRVLRQRAITAFASLSADRLGLLAGQLVAILVAPDPDGWVLAAVAAAT